MTTEGNPTYEDFKEMVQLIKNQFNDNNDRVFLVHTYEKGNDMARKSIQDYSKKRYSKFGWNQCRRIYHNLRRNNIKVNYIMLK